MTEQLDSFDPRSTYDEASRDYENAARDFWQYISIRTVERLDLKPGDRVLDVPCGSGASLVAAADRVGPSGRVVGVDYAEQMVAIAEEKARSGGLSNVELSVTDMTSLDHRQLEPFDAVVCSLGALLRRGHAGPGPIVVRARPARGRPARRWPSSASTSSTRCARSSSRPFGSSRRAVEVLEPWRRTEDASVLRDIFKAAGIDGERSRPRDDRLPLPSPDDWWRIVMGSGFRRTVAALAEPAALELRRRCDAYILDRGVDRITNQTHYAVIQREGPPPGLSPR